MQSVTQEDLVRALGPHDILCGRGSGPNDYRGNIKFRMLIYERREEYLASKTRRVKAQIAREIVDHVTSVFDPPGRFLKKIDIYTANRLGLKRGSPVWVQVNDATALEKVKQALRQNREYLAGNKISIPTSRPVEKKTNRVASENSVTVTKKTAPKKRASVVKKYGLKSAIEKMRSAEDVLRAYSANRDSKMIPQPPRLQGIEPPCVIENSGAFNSHPISSESNLFNPQNSSSDIQSVISRHASSLATTMPRTLQNDISEILSHLASSKGIGTNNLRKTPSSFSFSSPHSLSDKSSLSFLRPSSSEHSLMCQNLAPGCPTIMPHNLVSGSSSLAAHHLSQCDLALSSHRFPPRNFSLTSQNLHHGNSALRPHDLLSRNIALASQSLTSSNQTFIPQNSSAISAALQLHSAPARGLTLTQSLSPGTPALASQNLSPLKTTMTPLMTHGKPTLIPHNLSSNVRAFDFQNNRTKSSHVDRKEQGTRKDINLPLPDRQISGRFPHNDSVGSDDGTESDNPLLKWTRCSEEYYTRMNEKPNIIILWRRRR